MRNVFWGTILIGFGLLFLLDNMDVIDFGEVISTFWPVLLIVWGISVLLKRRTYAGTRVFSDIRQNISSELFHQSSVFGDLSVTLESQNFKGGSVSTVFGDNHVDLSGAVVAEGEHWLRMTGVFGDIGVTLPPGLACSITGSVMFGDIHVFDQKKSGFSSEIHYVTPGYETAANKLRLSISQVFGSVTVHGSTSSKTS